MMSRMGLVALLLSFSAVASAQHVENIVLSLSGEPVPVSEGDEIVLTGTISSTVDGSEIDAFSRRTGDLDFVDAGPYVNLPEGSELIDADVLSHRYVVRVGQDGTVSFAVQALAMQQLVTRTQAASALRGAFEVARPVAVADAQGVPLHETNESTTWWPFGALLALGAGALIPFARRRDPFAALLRRARRAHRSVVAEAERLGPAFSPIAASAAELLGSVIALQGHVQATHAARGRIRGTGAEAAERRLALTEEAGDSVTRADEIVDRLEGVAAHLAATVADHARATGVDEALELVGQDLDLALDADATARAI